jgi:hypothetical protein
MVKVIKIYDIAQDEVRIATQEDVDRLLNIAQAYGKLRQSLRDYPDPQIRDLVDSAHYEAAGAKGKLYLVARLLAKELNTGVDLGLARKVLSAMRGPTPEMLDGLTRLDKMWKDTTSTEVFNAMIDGALAP